MPVGHTFKRSNMMRCGLGLPSTSSIYDVIGMWGHHDGNCSAGECLVPIVPPLPPQPDHALFICLYTSQHWLGTPGAQLTPFCVHMITYPKKLTTFLQYVWTLYVDYALGRASRVSPTCRCDGSHSLAIICYCNLNITWNEIE